MHKMHCECGNRLGMFFRKNGDYRVTAHTINAGSAGDHTVIRYVTPNKAPFITRRQPTGTSHLETAFSIQQPRAPLGTPLLFQSTTQVSLFMGFLQKERD
ncbi:MAG: hypothetical protein ACI9VM_000492 [Candidatus Azotimanducaceae bacterium]|jgi:hypothetical protein